MGAKAAGEADARMGAEHPLDQTRSCRRVRAAFIEESGLELTADDEVVDATALAAELLRRWGLVRIGRGLKRERAKPEWLSDRRDTVAKEREFVAGLVFWILVVVVGGALTGVGDFVLRWGPEILLFGLPVVLVVIGLLWARPGALDRMEAGRCPACQYDVGSLGPRLVGRDAEGQTFEVRTGPPACPECGCPWPLVPRA